MKIALRKILIYSILTLIVLSCEEATITPIPPDYPKLIPYDSVWGEYFPNSPGTKWEYNVYIDNQFSHIERREIEKRILIKKNISASLWIYEIGGVKAENYVAIVEDTVFAFTNTNDLYNPQKILKSFILPLDEFRTWNTREIPPEFGNDKTSGGSNIGSVIVEAGTFNNVLEIEQITDAEDYKYHKWVSFVPGVGIIRIETIDNTSNQTTVVELKSYLIK